MFKELPGNVAVYRSKGRYKQGPLFTYDGRLFIRDGSAYIGINADGGTTDPNYLVDKIVYDGPLFADRMHRLHVIDGPERRSVAEARQANGIPAMGQLRIERRDP